MFLVNVGESLVSHYYCMSEVYELHSFQRSNLGQLTLCDLLRLIPLLGGFVLSVRRGFRFLFYATGPLSPFYITKFHKFLPSASKISFV